MSASGVFAVARSIWEDEDFAPEPFTEREAWMWLVSAAAWKTSRIRGARSPIELRRGEFSFAVRFLAEKWRWSKSRVSRFIDMIEKRDMIRDTSREVTRDKWKIYLINNYNKFQKVGMPERDNEIDEVRDKEWDNRGTTAGQPRDKEETSKHLNIIKEERDMSLSPSETDASLPQLFEPKEAGKVEPDLERAVGSYNAIAGPLGWPQCKKRNRERDTKLRLRIAEAGGTDAWCALMDRAGTSPFLRGETGRGQGHEGWVPDLDFFLQAKKLTSLMEGKYDGRKPMVAAVNGEKARTERMEWLKAYGFDGRWEKNNSGNGVWRDTFGVGPPPDDPRTLVTEDDLKLFPKALERRDKMRKQPNV